MIEALENLVRRNLQLFLNNLYRFVAWEGSYGMLEFSKLIGQVVREEVRSKAHQLPQLDEGRSEIFKKQANPFGKSLLGDACPLSSG